MALRIYPTTGHARRLFVSLLAALALVPALAHAFGFDDLAREAETLAGSAYRQPPPPNAALARLSYDDYRRIRFRAEQSLWRDTGSLFQVQFFAPGRSFARPLRLFEVVGGDARPLQVPGSAYEDEGLLPPALARSDDAGAAGWRVRFPLNDVGMPDEVVVFLGASYFRAVGAGQRYGLSARGLAVDTVGGRGEEFPAFTAFWLERPAPGVREMRFYALLDGPSVTGAYRFVLRPGSDTVLDVQARLYLRQGVATLGIAPLTSMFLAGENQPVASDYRPEVHDSDGLLVHTGAGERIWRPLTNPARPFVSSFAMASPAGFGLMQRDRAFTSFEDLEAHYERRPSAWVEPLGDWGAGRVELLQFGTPDETHDNIAAYWVPQRVPAQGVPIDFAWRVHWTLDATPRAAVAWVLQTRRGHGFRPDETPANQLQFQIDFVGTSLAGLRDADGVEAVVNGNSNARNLRAHAYPNPERGGWRMSLEFERVDKAQPVELRAFLRRGDAALSETWSYALAPE